MLRSPQFLAGLAAGAVVTWWVIRRRESQLITATFVPKPLTRRGRMGQGWAGGQGGGSYQ